MLKQLSWKMDMLPLICPIRLFQNNVDAKLHLLKYASLCLPRKFVINNFFLRLKLS